MESPKPNWKEIWAVPLVQYIASVASVTAIAFVRLSLNPMLGERGQHLLFVPAVLFSALYGGVGPGVLAAVLSVVLSIVFTMHDPKVSVLAESSGQLGTALYLLVCMGILLLARREWEQKRQRWRAERELSSLNAQLERRVRERTAQLEAANKELEGFCYSVSHDLRTPMRAIAGNSRILLEDHADELSPDLQEKLVRMDLAANKLGSLVEGLLTYARLANQEIAPERINLSSVLQEIVEAVRRERKCEVVLEVEPDIWVMADAKMMRIALNALVVNAVQYRQPDKPAYLKFTSQTSDDRTVYTLSDQGIGFDLTYIGKIFQPFERLHRDEDYPGIGMGLAHVKRIIERHGGMVWAESEVGKGTSFSFVLSRSTTVEP